MMEINLLDIGVAVTLLIFLGRGLMRGLTREVGGLVGVICGFALARYFQASVEPTMETLFFDKNVAGIMAFLLILILTVIVVALLFFALRKFMSITLTLWVDHLLGAIAGLAKGLLILTLVFFLIRGFFPNMNIVESAQATPLFQSLAEYMRGFLPDVFTFRFPVRL